MQVVCVGVLEGIRISDVSNTLGFPLPGYEKYAREITARILDEIFPDLAIYTGNELPFGKLILPD
jgi:hypothetical protein